MVKEKEIIHMFCPNCGHKNAGYLLKSGCVSMQCSRCKCILVSKKMRGKQEYIIKLKK
jgi:hypothetical protein